MDKAQVDVDYSYSDFVNRNGQVAYIRIKANENSNLLTGSAVFKIYFKFLYLKNFKNPMIYPYKNPWEYVVEGAKYTINSYAPGARYDFDYVFGDYIPAKVGGVDGSLVIISKEGSTILKGSVKAAVAYSWL
ncbi:hypothetical protein SHELI_v1c09910 [Spiroplasma helicoides]|uniref:Uncharacterized protein n=1 Tax=Spiroplasma helicoides TaxID=216938 RepID=A0A1B3SLY1_9MOLU|nr:hypothetical protein [Spiroplasma helicoides]AOG60938.1 hypothetical protein SHELI_v1c09910 [Spiroplasma helicoides]